MQYEIKEETLYDLHSELGIAIKNNSVKKYAFIIESLMHENV